MNQRRYKNALTVIKSLEQQGFPTKLAGGCVRDRLLGLTPKDFDLASVATPEQVCAVFKQKSIKVVATGLEHGTVTVVIDGQPLEVTTLRRDVATDGRRAVVAFTESFEEDAARRDFTINAMFEDADGTVHDYFSGRKDLQAKVLRFVGDAEDRIKEDYLRILRYFRFWARFGFQPVPGALSAISNLRDGLGQISQERITSELMQTLASEHVACVMPAMFETGVLALILPPVTLERQKVVDLVSSCSQIQQKDRGIARLAACLEPCRRAEDAKSVGARLKLSSVQVQQLLVLLTGRSRIPAPEASPALVMEFIDWCEGMIGEEGFLSTLVPYWEQVADGDGEKNALLNCKTIEGQLMYKRRAVLPVNGQILMEQLGLKPGKDLGDLLAKLKHKFREGDWQTEEQGLDLARKLVVDLTPDS